MPIYSKNRSGLMDETKVTGFGMNDTGRALYESCINDRTIFNAMIKHDMNEINGLKEGTILESEIQSLNERSFKELVGSFVKALENLWHKIQGIFKDAIDKIAEYIYGNGKKFVAEFDVVKEKYKDSKVTINGKFINNKFKIIIPNETDIFKYIYDDDITAANVVSIALGESIGTNKDLTPNEYKAIVNENGFEEKKNVGINDSIVDEMRKTLLDARETISRLKKNEKDLGDIIKNTAKNLRNEKYADNTSGLKKITSAVESVVSTICHTAISYERSKVSMSRKALGALMAAVKSDNKSEVQHNSAVLTAMVEASIELDDAFDDTTEEVSDEVNELINSVE